jgi:hypothetical protein
MPENKHPIIAHGEEYIENLVNAGGFPNKNYPHEYDENVRTVLLNLDRIKGAITQKQEEFLSEKVLCIRLEPKFEAKSYVPTALITSRNDMRIIGGRKYAMQTNNYAQSAKLYFLKINDKGIDSLYDTLKKRTNDRNQNWVNQIRSIHSLDLLRPDEKIMGFPVDWSKGKLEIVLHPLQNEIEKMIERFYVLSGLEKGGQVNIKTYPSGLTFICTNLAYESVKNLSNFNPLRAIHPLGQINIPLIRANGLLTDAPHIVAKRKKSTVIVGMFDGGVDNSVPLLDGYVETHDCVPTAEDQTYKAHATGVCGAILHGELSDKKKNDILPVPEISVNSYRVLPLQDDLDIDLYEAIDAIEKIVKTHEEIKLFNLSFGPRGAILDDTINRFTYALDLLTYTVHADGVNPLFCVAVGNDGDKLIPFNRIQSPSDIVNGLGIGAYSLNKQNDKILTSYSCIGPGREGGKTKPDLLDFGGSTDRPFVIVDTQPDKLTACMGTSFAAPLTTRKIGMLMARSENILPHIGRILLIHHAKQNVNFPIENQGHGFCVDELDDLLTCNDNRVTILYNGLISPKKVIRLPIYAPRIDRMKGRVRIAWTIGVIVNPDVNDPDAYTKNCIEESFIPHKHHYAFSRGKEKRSLFLNRPEDKALAEELLAQGFKQPSYPVTKPRKKNWDESDLRKNELKWDTVIKDFRSMDCTSLFEPYLKLRAISRSDTELDAFKYFVVVTIEAKKYQGSLYDTILQEYRNLMPIEIRDANRIMVDIIR